MRKILATIAVLILFAVSVTSASAMTHGPRIKVKNGTSTNWSGYAALTDLLNPLSYVVSDVKGTWIIPMMTCDSNTTYSSAWIGMDGYSNGTVEQTGTEHDCSNGTASYYAWYEMYPKPSYRVPLTLHAGDVIYGEVKYVGGKFTLTLNNTTTGKSYTTTQRSNKALRSSAEWIVEAPWSGGVLPLANFGTLPFSNSYATLGATTGSVSVFTNDKITMTTSDGSITKALTSPLATDGASFSVQWQHN